MTDLQQRTRRAFAAQGVTALIGKLISVALGVVLARLLFPDDYGVYALALIVTSLVQLLSNAGFQSYLIQAPSLDRHAIDICYSLNLAFSWGLGAVMAAGAWLWPGIHVELRVVVCLYGLQVAVSGLSYVPLALFKRDLDFHVSSRAELAYSIISMSGRVGLAAAGLGALCFPLGDLLGALVRHVYVLKRSTARPTVTWPHRAEARPILWFGVHATSAGLASFIANQVDKMLLGASFTATQIGLYTFGNLNASLFHSAFIVPQVAVFQAAYARLRDDLAQARRLVLRSSRMGYSLSLPVQLLLILETDRIVTAVFSAKWLPAVPLVQIFAFDFLVRAIFNGLSGIQLSFGLADRTAITKWQGAALFVVALVIAAVADVPLTGYAIAYVAANMAAACLNLVVNGRLVELPYGRFFANLLMPSLLAAASTLVWFLFARWFGDRGLWLTLVANSLAWGLPYLALTVLFNREVITSITGALRGRLRG